MNRKLDLYEALRKLAHSRRVTISWDRIERTKVRPAHQANANDEFSEPPSADTTLCVGILIILAFIDFFALKWL